MGRQKPDSEQWIQDEEEIVKRSLDSCETFKWEGEEWFYGAP